MACLMQEAKLARVLGDGGGATCARGRCAMHEAEQVAAEWRCPRFPLLPLPSLHQPPHRLDISCLKLNKVVYRSSKECVRGPLQD